MAATTEYSVTAPNGAVYTFRSRMNVAAVRFLDVEPSADGLDRWLISRHRTVEAALNGPNQTPAWNRYRRYVVTTDGSPLPEHASKVKGKGEPVATRRNVGPCPGCGIRINLDKPCPVC